MGGVHGVHRRTMERTNPNGPGKAGKQNTWSGLPQVTGCVTIYYTGLTSCGRGGVGTPPLPQLFLSPASLWGVALRGREREGEPGGDKEARKGT
jgi:hypothetical protein